MSDTSWWEARDIARGVSEVAEIESVPLVASVYRTLARDVVSLVDLPGFPTAAMDGWVVAGDGPWMITGTIDTGIPTTRALEDGQAMRIATGGRVPSQARAVIPWEMVEVRDNVVHASLPEKLHVRPQAEECARGDVLAHRSDVINPALAGSLAAAGLDEVEVFRRPRAAVIVVGDEVVDSGLPADGQVRDALGIQLPGWVQALGGEVVSFSRVRDTQAELTAALYQAVQCSDVVIVTGGTARGHRDFLRASLEELGAHFHVDGVAVRPGHPMMLAELNATPLVGLPGNPLSALVAVVTLLAPMMDSWCGRTGSALPAVHMAEEIPPARKELTRLMVGRRELGGFRQVPHVSSAMLRGIAHADGWAVVPPRGVQAGETVPWIPVPWVRRTSED